MTQTLATNYETVYARSLADPESFWSEVAEGVDWTRRWDRVLDDSEAPMYRWFTGGVLNTCHNALDRHVAGGRADQDAIIYDSAMTGERRRITFAQSSSTGSPASRARSRTWASRRATAS